MIFQSLLQRLVLRFSKYEGFANQFLLALFADKKSRAFTAEHLRFSPKVSRVLRRKNPRTDKFILERNPKLVWSQEQKPRVLIDKNYTPEGEIRIDNKPYLALYKAIQSLLLKEDVNSVLEIGCTSGNLLEIIRKSHPSIQLKGLEIFEFLKMAAPDELRENILIRDLRDPILDEIESDLTICLEVAEHIDPGYLDNFLSNVTKLSNHLLVMSWSTSYPEQSAPPQHISPIWKYQYKRIMKTYGFQEKKKLTKSLKSIAENEQYFHKWWLSTVTVWSKVKN